MKLIIMRGLPGSGKSRAAAEIAESATRAGKSVFIASADAYFENDGVYEFDPAKLPLAHAACMHNVLVALKSRTSVIIVDNTNSQTWEYASYVRAADLAGYKVVMHEIHTRPQQLTVEELMTFAKRNVHGVPFSAIAAMAARWE